MYSKLPDHAKVQIRTDLRTHLRPDTFAVRNQSHSTHSLFTEYMQQLMLLKRTFQLLWLNLTSKKSGHVIHDIIICKHHHFDFFLCLRFERTLRIKKWSDFFQELSLISRDQKKKSAVLHYGVVDQTELFWLTLYWNWIFGLKGNSYLRLQITPNYCSYFRNLCTLGLGPKFHLRPKPDLSLKSPTVCYSYMFTWIFCFEVWC